MIHFSQLPEISNGKVLQLAEDSSLEELILDSRRSSPLPNSVFIAIKGSHHDGHAYISEVHVKGIRQFIVEDPNISLPPDSNVFLAENSIQTLQDLAAWKRDQTEIETIGITGSNGKTIVKEWLASMLEPGVFLVKSPKSYNSQIGVPLSVWNIRPHHELGIFEAGISRTGEMENLEKIISPKTGIFTNIGPAHDAGFSSRTEKIREKARLFENSELIIYCKDHQDIDSVLKEMPKMLFTWGTNEESIIRIEKEDIQTRQTLLTLLYRDQRMQISIPFIDKASIENCMHCIAYLLFRNYSLEYLQEQVFNLSRVSMRLALKRGINNCYLIDDSYSNDLASLEVALDFMNQQPLQKARTLIISDILQTGMEDQELYAHLSRIIKSRNIHKLIGIGPAISAHRDLFQVDEMFFYENTQDLLGKEDSFSEELILVKGARKFEFEKIVKALQQKIHGTVLEINLDALVHNLNFYRSRLAPETMIMVMVKALAYGSGSNEIAHLLQYHNVDYLGVAYTDEAVALRRGGIHVPIMIMNPNQEDFEKIIRYNLEPEIFGMDILQDLLEYLAGTNEKARVHVKLDTGMHRLGFQENELDQLANLLKESTHLEVASVFSHLAGADSSDHDEFSRNQAVAFDRMSLKLTGTLNEKPIRHLVNSAGIIRYPEFHFDMVRLGIGLYGFDSSESEQSKLQAVSTFKTTISQIRKVSAGETIGYGRVGKAGKDLTIATIAVGYADGFRRSFSDRAGSVLINGKRAEVIGNVCMDMTMVDISGIEANVGDEVILFGKDPGIAELAKIDQTIPYEILTNVSDRVKRVFYSE